MRGAGLGPLYLGAAYDVSDVVKTLKAGGAKRRRTAMRLWNAGDRRERNDRGGMLRMGQKVYPTLTSLGRQTLIGRSILSAKRVVKAVVPVVVVDFPMSRKSW